MYVCLTQLRARLDEIMLIMDGHDMNKEEQRPCSKQEE